jgi:DNA polymerase-1
MTNKLVLIDAYSQIYRAFYAIRHLTAPDGTHVNAVFGLTKMLRKLLVEQQPTHAAMVYDLGAPRQRLAILPSYKEQRPPTPLALEAQLPAIRDVLAGLRLPVVEQDGEEADDLIATLATQAAGTGWDVLIASSDKDFTQLVNDRIRLIRTESKETVFVDAAAVEKRYGVRPDQMVDYLSLVGDAVDNIPGIPGIGDKTAAGLLRTHGDIEHLLAAAPGLPTTKLRQSLLTAAPRLYLNRRLVALRCDLPHLPDLSALQVGVPDVARLRDLYAGFGFKSLLAELQSPGTLDLFPNS